MPPVVSLTSDVTTGTAPVTAHLDASGTTDPGGYAVTYTWTVSTGGTLTSSGATATASLPNHGSYTVTVTANDGHASTASKSFVVTVNPAPPTVTALTIPVNSLGVAPTTTSAQLSAADRESLALTYAISTPPSVGSATINSNTGAISYTAPANPNATSDSFVVHVSNLGATTTSTVNVTLNGDPLLGNQWHLQNTGQNAFASVLPVAGNDLDVAGAWAAGYSGHGVKVGVVDTGLEVLHEDLAANVDTSHSINFVTGTSDPTPSVSGDDHGTMVSGIIGAVAFNNKGGRGVAFNSTLRGYNLIAPTAYSVANMAAALGGSTQSADNDLFNASFGAVSNALPTFSGTFQAITATTIGMRGGKGAVIVNAAGNDFSDISGQSSPLCQLSNQFAVSCGDPATDERRGGTTPLIVAALNSTGTHASYSETGSSVWISAPGGEYGDNSGTMGPTYTAMMGDPTHDVMPAIITTALDGCNNAMNPWSLNPNIAWNPLDALGANPLAANCQYTAMMNGTSAATPNVAGVVALMLEANPNLTTRDIKYILAKTAKKVDPTWAGVTSTNVVNGASITLEQGWTQNAAGWWFSNRYGFGAVDAAAAVAMAASYTTYLPAEKDSAGYTFTPANPATIAQGATGNWITYPVSETFSTVEQVVVFLNIAQTPGMPCNQVELISPSGTKSILLHGANGFTNAALVNTRILSNAFYGEPVNGNWTLHFYDYCVGNSTATVLPNNAPQALLLTGH